MNNCNLRETFVCEIYSNDIMLLKKKPYKCMDMYMYAKNQKEERKFSTLSRIISRK